MIPNRDLTNVTLQPNSISSILTWSRRVVVVLNFHECQRLSFDTTWKVIKDKYEITNETRKERLESII